MSYADTKVEPLTPTSRVLLDVEAERLRQVREEGWTPEHDDEHVNLELARAAGSYVDYYCSGDESLTEVDEDTGAPRPWDWPWATEWWKPKDQRRDLIRAAALIVAEIERLDRAC